MDERRLRISGRSSDLDHLAEMFADGDVRVVEDDGEHFLVSGSFSGFGDDHVGLVSYGEDLLAQLDGVARLDSNHHRPSRLDLTIHDSGGVQHTVVRGEAALHIGVTLSAQGTVSGGVAASGSVSPDPGPPPGVKRFDRGQRDPAVKTVLGLLAAEDWGSWVNLYRVLDWVADAYGGKAKLVASGLMTEDELDRFGASANRHEVSGDEARHGPMRGDPPKRTMDVGEARTLIRRIVRGWIDSSET